MAEVHLLTTSRIRSMAQCPRKHYYTYELGVRPAHQSKALRMGTLYHETLHAFKQGFPWDQVLEAAEYADLPDIERACVRAMVVGWTWCWQNDGMEVLASERSYEIPLPNPATGRGTKGWRRAGQIDGIAQFQGQIVVLEHKTTGVDIGPDSGYWAKLRMDSQVSNYHTAARALKYDVVGVLYDVARKPNMNLRNVPLLDADGLKVVLDADGNRVLKKDGTPRQTPDKGQGLELQSRLETVDEWYVRTVEDMYARPDYYFARKYIARLDSELHDADVDNFEWAKLIQTAQKDGYWPRNTAACSDYGVCPYFQVCADGLDIMQEMPEGFVMLDNVHPELKEN